MKQVEKHIKEALSFRHATKKFAADKRISDEHMQLILEAARLAPSSYGFEPWNIIVAQDEALREALKQHCMMNGARFEASHMLIFTAKTGLELTRKGGHIDHALKDVLRMNAVARLAYKTFWKKWAKNNFRLMRAEGDLHAWAARQAYIALGFSMFAAAELRIDSCPIEGFDIDGAAKVLTNYKLIDPAKDQPVVLLALGYRAEQPHQRHRRDLDEIVQWH